MSPLTGGYDYKFVDSPPDRLICKICHLTSLDPYLSVCCGHTFCSSCLENAKKANVFSCPFCRDEKFITFPNKQVDREIRSLHVMCINKEKGCEWQGELNDINNHLGNSGGCQFEAVNCSNECGKVLQRRYLTSHVETECPRRKVDCQYCHITGEHQFIEGEHKEQCPKLPLPCPNKCDVGSVPREDMETHKNECPLEEIKCSFECGKMLKRQDLAKHVEIECPCRKVVCRYCQTTDEHQVIYGQHYKEECPMLPLPCPNRCEVGTVFRKDMETHNKECPLEMVQCEYHNVGCEERMMRKDLEQHNSDKIQDHLSMIKSELLISTQEQSITRQRLADVEQQLALKDCELTNTKSRLDNAFEQINTLMILMHQSAVTQRQTIYNGGAASMSSAAQWWAKLRALTAMGKSGNQICPVILNITKFNTKKVNHVEWYSDSFFAYNKGYKICLSVYPAGNGDGKGTHLSVFLCLMKGPHDDELTFPLREKFEVKLLNQISDCEHYSSTIDYYEDGTDDCAVRVTDHEKTKGWGSQEFVSNDDLHKVAPTCQYLKDECIFLQVHKL